jgi:large subunit ribosomal protein L30e
MSKILEKSLRDARKEDKLTMGAKQVLNSIKNSKLIVLSQSIRISTISFNAIDDASIKSILKDTEAEEKNE